jgi:hypothetical protein
LFRLFERYLSPIEDPNVRLSEAETIYAELYPIACMIVARIEGRGV